VSAHASRTAVLALNWSRNTVLKNLHAIKLIKSRHASNERAAGESVEATGEDEDLRYDGSIPEIFSIHRLALARWALL
jgi:hypothetical protein